MITSDVYATDANRISSGRNLRRYFWTTWNELPAKQGFSADKLKASVRGTARESISLSL